jgi:SAM-dependent methyltransferase
MPTRFGATADLASRTQPGFGGNSAVRRDVNDSSLGRSLIKKKLHGHNSPTTAGLAAICPSIFCLRADGEIADCHSGDLFPRATEAAAAMSIDAANRAAMATSSAVMHYAHADYLDPGEALLYRRVQAEIRGQPVLDIGVGGGRTVPSLLEMSTDYVGLDYTPAMVEHCRARFPGVRFELGDARELRFAPGTFALVVFSCAGLDMVAHEDRRTILREVRRVLRPGGAFVFSTHNLDYPAVRTRWRALVAKPALSANPLRTARSVVGSVRRTLVQVRNHFRLRRLEHVTGGWALLNSSYHEFSTLMHCTTAAAQRAELREEGFADGVELYTNEAAPISGDSSSTNLMHVLARASI